MTLKRISGLSDVQRPQRFQPECAEGVRAAYRWTDCHRKPINGDDSSGTVVNWIRDVVKPEK